MTLNQIGMSEEEYMDLKKQLSEVILAARHHLPQMKQYLHFHKPLT